MDKQNFDAYGFEIEPTYVPIEEEYTKLMDHKTLFEEFQIKLREITDLLYTSEQIALNLFAFYNFDSKKLVQEFLVQEDAQSLIKLSMADQGIFSTTDVKFIELNTCPICQNQKSKGMFLQCGHAFCEDCWKQMINVQFSYFNPIVKCLQDQCQQRLPHIFLSQFDLYKRILIKRLMLRDPSLVQCPGKGCDHIFKCYGFKKAITVEKSINLIYFYFKHCKCLCGIKFCQNCKNEKHYPIPCEIIKKIQNLKLSDDAWVDVNSTCCPKCGIFVQKTKGCTHVICFCKADFCGSCGKIWQTDHENSFSKCPYKNILEIDRNKAVNLFGQINALENRHKELNNQIQAFYAKIKKVKLCFIYHPLNRLLKLLNLQKWLAFYDYALIDSQTVFKNLYEKFDFLLKQFISEDLQDVLKNLEHQEQDDKQIESIYPAFPQKMRAKLIDLVILKRDLIQFIEEQAQ